MSQSETTDHWDPRLYAEGSDFQWRIATRLQDTLELKETRRLLDVGCGDGRLTHRIAASYPTLQVVGLDKSGSMVAHARSRYGHRSNLRFEVGDIETYQASLGFDIIHSFWALSWLQDHEAAARSMVQVLAPGGRLLLLIPLNNRHLYQSVEKIQSSPVWAGSLAGLANPVNSASLELYLEVYTKLGFAPTAIRHVRYAHSFPGPEPLGRYFKGWLPHVHRLPIGQRAALILDLITVYNQELAATGDPEHSIRFDCVLVQGALR